MTATPSKTPSPKLNPIYDIINFTAQLHIGASALSFSSAGQRFIFQQKRRLRFSHTSRGTKNGVAAMEQALFVCGAEPHTFCLIALRRLWASRAGSGSFRDGLSWENTVAILPRGWFHIMPVRTRNYHPDIEKNAVIFVNY